VRRRETDRAQFGTRINEELGEFLIRLGRHYFFFCHISKKKAIY
jgi:hypothetical protein